MPTGTHVGYVAGRGHRPLPTTTDLLYRRAHAERPVKPSGLDWAALAPTCASCGDRSNEVSVADGLCPTCNPKTQPPPKPATTDATSPPVGGIYRARGGRRVDRERIVTLYTEGATVSEIWAATGHAEATIRKTIDAAGVAKRDDRKSHRPAAPTNEHVRRPGMRVELADLGVTSRDVKDWGFREGLLLEAGQPGLPPRRVLDAYIAAHPREVTP